MWYNEKHGKTKFDRVMGAVLVASVVWLLALLGSIYLEATDDRTCEDKGGVEVAVLPDVIECKIGEK